MSLTQSELSRYRERLLSRMAELEKGVHRLDRIAVETAADLLENLQLASEREVAISKLDREAVLLGEVRAALARISDGTYGVCLECEREIPRGRLEAVPWAKYCVRCQEAADHNGSAPSNHPAFEDSEAA